MTDKDLDIEPAEDTPATWENVVVGKATELAGRVLHKDEMVEEGEAQQAIAHEVREEHDEQSQA